mgnify:CR=1 FL=1
MGITAVPVSGRTVALSGAVIGLGLLGDTLIYAVLPLYHEQFGISLAMVGVLLSLNRWVRLFANSAMAHIGERIGPRALMISAAVGAIASTTCYGLDGGDALQIAARMLWGFSFAALNLGSLAYAVADRANAGKRVGASRGIIGVTQATCFIAGGFLVLSVGPRHVFLILGAFTVLALVAALMLPHLPPEPSRATGFRLPKPHRLEIWGFLLPWPLQHADPGHGHGARERRLPLEPGELLDLARFRRCHRPAHRAVAFPDLRAEPPVRRACLDHGFGCDRLPSPPRLNIPVQFPLDSRFFPPLVGLI